VEFDFDRHAGVMETSQLLGTHAELVKMEPADDPSGSGAGSLHCLRSVNTPASCRQDSPMATPDTHTRLWQGKGCVFSSPEVSDWSSPQLASNGTMNYPT
jgi:hypothetical protein